MIFNSTKLTFIFLSIHAYTALVFISVGNVPDIPDADWRISFNHPQGFHTDKFHLELTAPDPDLTIRFTLDGSEPGLGSRVYSTPIFLPERLLSFNMISSIPTNPDDSPDCWIWKPPSGALRHGTVVRARLFLDDEPVSRVYTKTYLTGFDEEEFDVPVISLVTDPSHLFDHESGIYIPGLTNEMNPGWPTVWGTGNYHNRGEDWERPAVLTIFNQNGDNALQQHIGVRIHGGGSRSMPIKSLRLYARDRYDGAYLHYPFFADQPVASFRRLILRNSGQDFKYSYLNDAISHVLIRHLDIETQWFQPAILFINGEYWGIHNIRERIDKYYLEYRKGVDPDALDLLTGPSDVVEGSNESYRRMLRYIRLHDTTLPEVYEELEKQMDMDNFIDYNIAKQYIGVYDWPGNNVDYWRPHTAYGRWRWIYYDNDGAFTDHEHDFYAHSTLEGGEEWPNPDWSTFLFRNLMKNQAFKDSYVERFAYHLENTFTTERVTQVIDSLATMIRPLMPDHIKRWNYPESMPFWESRIDRMKRFARQRPCIARSMLIYHLDLDPDNFLPDLCSSTYYREEASSAWIQAPIETSLVAYPNPTTGDQLWVEYKGPSMGRSDLELVDMTGRSMLLIQRAFQDADNQISLNVSGLPKGMYILVVRGPESVTAQPVIIQ